LWRGGESVLPLLYSAVTPPHSVTARRTSHRFFHAVPVNEGWSPTPVPACCRASASTCDGSRPGRGDGADRTREGWRGPRPGCGSHGALQLRGEGQTDSVAGVDWREFLAGFLAWILGPVCLDFEVVLSSGSLPDPGTAWTFADAFYQYR
jgi:hypothetical protein